MTLLFMSIVRRLTGSWQGFKESRGIRGSNLPIWRLIGGKAMKRKLRGGYMKRLIRGFKSIMLKTNNIQRRRYLKRRSKNLLSKSRGKSLLRNFRSNKKSA